MLTYAYFFILPQSKVYNLFLSFRDSKFVNNYYFILYHTQILSLEQ